MSRYIRNLLLEKLKLFAIATILTIGVVHGAIAAPSQTPLFLTNASKPIITLVLSADHELYKKAYNDYSNLDGGLLTTNDSTYRNDFKYYGYFDSDWCYTYTPNTTTPADSYFTPMAGATNHKCATGNNYWSGNFLNWATMTRVDILRKVLYGGKRSVDGTSQTILERSYLPKDTHAFAKVYTKDDMNELTPYTYNSSTLPAISMCNVSSGVNGYPIFKVAKGVWRQWAASESVQCEYKVPNSDGSIPANHFSRPANADNLSEQVVKVDVCVTGKDGGTSARCKQYGSSALKKPFGILQTYGESGKIQFSLVTGSYKANTKGGVLRREASLIAKNATAANDEVNLATGQFNSVNGIIKNIDSFKTATYNSGSYTDCNTHSITVATVKGQATNSQRCSDWGNPISEIYLEALRYLTGNKEAVTDFNVNDATAIGTTFPGVPGLTQSLWGSSMADPWPSNQWCAKCFTIVLSTGANSFDGDDLSKVSDLPNLADVAALEKITNKIGTLEYSDFGTRSFFAGGTTNGERYCKPTVLGTLSGYRGMCPEQPATEGSYHIAGLAYYAHTQDLRTHEKDQKITTYAIDLAESLPKFTVRVNNIDVEFLPACEAQPSGGNWQTCSLIDVTVESLTYDPSNKLVAGSYLFYWEDSLWGNDYDFDGAQRISFCVGSSCSPAIADNKIKIINSVPYAFAGNSLHFSYNIVGVGPSVTTNVISKQSSTPPTTTASDLTSFAGGILTPWADRPGGQNFNTFKSPADSIPATVTRVESVFTASSSNTAVLLKRPLYYVAKYGGFTDKNGNNQPDDDDKLTTTVNESEWDSNGDSIPDNYFSVKNPSLLESSLESVFKSILGSLASASSAAVSSSRLSEGAYVYQARFNSTYWSGELVAYQYNTKGVLSTSPVKNSTERMKINNNNVLNIWTSTSHTPNTDAVQIKTNQTDTDAWNLLSAQQKADLAGAATTTLTAAEIALGQKRLNWIRGNSTYEDHSSNTVAANRLLRTRTNLVEKPDGSKEVVRNIIGDIVNSSPVYDGAKDAKYETLPGSGSSYVSYLNAKRLKKPRIFVGANDGMIHAFDAQTLDYVYSYLPPSAYPQLSKLTRTDYGTSANEHKFYMDGQITIGDAFINGAWHTVLVAATGAGGKNIFALDITNDTPKLIFSFDSSSQPKLGYVMGKPFIAPMQNNRFVAIFANGYEAATTTTSLFVVDLESPTSTSYSKIIDADATVAAANGLSTPALLPDIMGRVEYAYAGDLKGNLWRFDLRTANTSNWKALFSIFTAEDSVINGKPQPIFAAPTLGYNALRNNRVMVYFGTGKYYEDTDTAAGTTKNSFYAVIDNFQSAPYSRQDLVEKVITTSGNKRTLSNDTVNIWSTASTRGWYIDFPLGERITVKPLLIFDRLIFPTLIPSADPCAFGGTSWLMEAVAVGDKADTNPMLGEILKNDFLILGDLSFGIVPTLDDTGQIIISTSDGKVTPQSVNIKSGIGRVNWRQLD